MAPTRFGSHLLAISPATKAVLFARIGASSYAEVMDRDYRSVAQTAPMRGTVCCGCLNKCEMFSYLTDS